MNTGAVPFRRLFFLLCIIWFALNAPVLLGHKLLPWDAMDEFYPTVYFNAHNLRLGIAPWWNPYIYGGTPAIADPQGMLFSPLLMAWMLLPQSLGPVWFDWGVLLHLLMGGTAMLAVLRNYRANAVGMLLGAMVFMAGGVAASRLEHVPIVIAYAYAPVVMLALKRFIACPTPLRGCFLGLASGVMATHLVQVTYLFALVFTALAITDTWGQWPAYKNRDRFAWFGGMALAGIIAAIIAMPQLLFSSAFMAVSNRAVVPLDAVDITSLDLRAFMIMLVPNAYYTFQGGPYAGPADFVESYLYIGVVPLLTLAFSMRAWKQSENRRIMAFFAAIGVLSTLYMMGANTPFYPWLYTWLPGLTHFRRPADAAYILNYALAVWVGICATRIDLQSRRELTFVLAMTVALLALAASQMHSQHGRLFLALAVAVVALWQLRRKQGEWHVALWLSIVLAVDYAGYNLNGRFNEGGKLESRFKDTPAARYLAGYLDGRAGELPYRFTTHGTSVTWDNGGELLDIASTQGYNPLRVGMYEDMYRPRESSNKDDRANPLNAPPFYTLDRLLAVRYVLVGRRRDKAAWTAPPGYVHVFGDGGADVWRDDGAYPRILNPRQAMLQRVDEPIDPIKFGATDFRKVVWLTPRDERDAESDKIAARICTGTMTVSARATFTRASIDVHGDEPGWTVLDDLDAPGWRASIDGRDAPIHRANGLFRAVCVPAGNHRLVFSFHPLLMIFDALEHSRRKPAR